MAERPTLKQLLYFISLADAGHYRKAAERVGISQPSLSLQINKLEEILDLELVERGRSGAVLTPEGREVLEKAQGILADVAELQEISKRMKIGLAGTIRLGTSLTLGPYLMPSVVRLLHEQYPDLRLIIGDAAPSDLLDQLMRGKHDLILTQLPVKSSDVIIVRLIREPLHLAVALDHTLANAKSAKSGDLANENVILLSDRFTLHNQVAEIAQEEGANLRKEYEGTSLDALRQMTAMNMGVTFLPALYAHSEIPKAGGDVKLVSFRGGRMTRSIGLVWRKSSGSHATFRLFANMIRAVAKDRFNGLVWVED